MAGQVLLAALPSPAVTRELVSSLSVSPLSFIHMYLNYAEDTGRTLGDVVLLYLWEPQGWQLDAITLQYPKPQTTRAAAFIIRFLIQS